MSKTWRFLDLPTESYAQSTMALAPALARARKENLVPDTMALFTFGGPSLVMGYYISPDSDVDLAYCQSQKIDIKRIPTQGLIFGHEGYILTGLYIDRSFLPEDMTEGYRKLNEGVAREIERRWGLRARHRPLNDLEIEIDGKWKKIGPQALTFDGDIAVQRLGLTVSPLPIRLVERAIVPPPEKFADKEAKSVAERVGSLEEALGRPVSLDEAREMMLKAVEETFEVVLNPGTLTEREQQFQKYFQEQYDNEEWFYAKSVKRRFADLPSGTTMSQFVYKVSGGPLIRINLCILNDQIYDILITGNMQPARREMPEDLEAVLRKSPAREAAIEKNLRKEWQDKKMVIAGARVEDFISAVSGALKKITP
jgi:lipoate---protein ligase